MRHMSDFNVFALYVPLLSQTALKLSEIFQDSFCMLKQRPEPQAHCLISATFAHYVSSFNAFKLWEGHSNPIGRKT